MDRTYQHLIQMDGTYIVQEVRADGLTRIVAAAHPTYLAWLAAGGVAEEVAYVAPAGPTLEEAKAARCAEVNALRDAKIAAGVTVTFPDGSAVVQTRDEADLRNVQGVASQGLASLVQGKTDPLVFRDAANNNHTMSPAEAVDFGQQVADGIQAVYSASWALKESINGSALTDVAAVQTLDITAGWPEA
ncbi:hypothetical protein JCM15519_06780 [Fundidesulfovibrio butyratiphilus]